MHISDMANEAISMVTMSVDSFVRKDVKLAKAAIEADDKVDARFLEVKRELIELVRSDSGDAEYFMDLLMAAKVPRAYRRPCNKYRGMGGLLHHGRTLSPVR